jgi:hypothetical protein
MKRSNFTLVLYLSLVFASGLLVGAFGERLYLTHPVIAKTTPPRQSPEEYRRSYVAEMTNRLHLSPEQLSELNSILDQTRDQFRPLRDKYRADTKAIHERQVERVRAILNENQRVEYEKMLAEREQRKREEAKPAPPRL